MITRTASELSKLCGATLEGDGDRAIVGPASLADARGDDISFLRGGLRNADEFASTAAGAVVVATEFESSRTDLTLLRCADPSGAFSRIIEVFRPAPEPPPPGVHSSAELEEGVELGAGVSVGPFCHVGAGVVLGEGVVLHANVTLGARSSIGAQTVLYPSVVTYANTVIGERCVVHAGSVIGSDGFGFEPTASGWEKVPQCGHVLIEDDVEIGANCTIDRGRFGPTKILRSSKLDNLVHVAHNASIGPAALLVAQVGIAGSARVGERAILAGQSGVNGHREVGDGARIGGGAAVIRSVAAGGDYWGNPAIDMKQFIRAYKLFGDLPAIVARLKRLESRIESQNRGLGEGED